MQKYRGARRNRRKRAPRRRRPRRTFPVFLLFLLAFAATLAFTQGYRPTWLEDVAGGSMSLVGAATAETSGLSETSKRISFAFCHMGGGYNCVVDGDTIWLEGEKIRIADIDTPETHDYRCPAERELGDRATVRLREILEAGTITLKPIDRDTDRYGRKLRIVLVDGKSVGKTLVDEGLARWYEGGRRPWC
ncbi:thermonuclease family protein [Sphingopyxis flava]|uniref:Endonuclease YncB, thermonuclease family n=1 Tax=Sphingopyxis flava TaxID=1507287 RepID=A0A1T5GK94_9SPHN|nr:thermonuclease family protein [Sphingopyxis flava]SKC08835.1 Endonuclease YncB, thermonuclease family [Sphingopyxis flava]